MAVPYGFLTLQDLASRRVTEVGVDVVTTAVTQSVAEHNRQMNALLTGGLVRPTTDFKTRFRTATVAQLQPMTERGRPLPVQPTGQYDVAFPIKHGAISWGATRVARAKMTVAEAAETTSALMSADFRTVRKWLIQAMMVDGSWNYTDPEHGTLVVKGLASGDSDTYNVFTGADSSATDDHVLATASLDVTDFTTIHDELMEHPENGGDVIVIVPSASRAAVEAMTGFYPINDMNIIEGANTARLARTPSAPVPGEVFGYLEGCFVTEWRSFPSNYLFGYTTEGEPPFAMREDAEEELRGFSLAAEEEKHPFWERVYERRAGFGAWNRVGGVVMRTDNGTFAAAAGYTVPAES